MTVFGMPPAWQGKFRIASQFTSEHQITIVDERDAIGFVLIGLPGESEGQLNWRAECLLQYFNLELPPDTGGIT